MRLHNLFAPRTSLIGREREVADVTRLLRTTRLLTLTGAGGVGKTRLALQVAASVVDQYPHGVWLVELAPLTDGTLVARAVCAALGVPELPDRPPLRGLVRFLGRRHLLLLLDNCEHLVDVCAGLVDALLGGCSRLRVLATSREPLNVAGETVWTVPSLSVPPRPGVAPPADPAGYAAVQLFIERAQAVQPGFALTRGNGHTVAEICRQLDGIPLALKYAGSPPAQRKERAREALALVSRPTG